MKCVVHYLLPTVAYRMVLELVRQGILGSGATENSRDAVDHCNQFVQHRADSNEKVCYQRNRDPEDVESLSYLVISWDA
jgi:hypothetical protein